ncbi:TM2 domain-containing protein [Holzapfeliella sp. JNUCC 80]
MNYNLTTEEQILVNSEVEKNSKNIVVAYLLCLFFGVLGIHRYYLGKKGSAILMTVLAITVVGSVVSAVWAFVDLFLIPGIINENKKQVEQEAINNILSRKR